MLGVDIARMGGTVYMGDGAEPRRPKAHTMTLGELHGGYTE